MFDDDFDIAWNDMHTKVQKIQRFAIGLWIFWCLVVCGGLSGLAYVTYRVLVHFEIF